MFAPVGHGLWTAILGGVLFAASRRGRTVTGGLVAAYVGVSVLHALWDSMPVIALVVTLLLTGRPWQYELLLHGWLVAPTDTQVQLYTGLDWIGLGVIAVIGLMWLMALARRSTAVLRVPVVPPVPLPDGTTRQPRSGGQQFP